ncbi:MAG: YcxB family protein [Bacilli bacterium]|nr:YcxB family protein [Bacilli bacterium]MDD4076363.1 YcxB family protein [Bacilli bacterium]MDD4388679.1 YcxB family protein [Bacilli bacterium]
MLNNNNFLTIKLSHSQTRIKDFFRFHLARKSGVNIIYLLISIISLVTGIVLLIVNIGQFAFFFFFTAVIIWLLRSIMIKTTVNRLIQKVRPPSMHYILTFKDGMITYQTDNDYYTYGITELDKIYETTNYFYFYINRNKALTLPKSIMTAVEKDILNNILKRENIKVFKVRFK